MKRVVKSAGIIIRERKLLMTRESDSDKFLSPGGRVEQGEKIEDALIRELKEELDIKITHKDIEFFGTHEGVVDGGNVIIEVHSYIVNRWDGEPKPNNIVETIEEIAWVDSTSSKSMNLGSVFAHQVIPRLKELGLID